MGITESQIWFNRDELCGKLMATAKEGEETLVERPIKVEFIDVPKIYHYNDPNNCAFFSALAETGDHSILELKVI